jgi:hypothetical protein
MLLFVDESGHDHGEAPYEVLAGVAVSERDLWNLIQAIRAAELEFFGIHMTEVGIEFKGKKLLKNKSLINGAIWCVSSCRKAGRKLAEGP